MRVSIEVALGAVKQAESELQCARRKLTDALNTVEIAPSASANSENAPCDHRFILAKGHVTCIVCQAIYPCAV